MGCGVNGRGDGKQEAPPVELEPIRVEAVEPNPILRGDVRVPNYFKDFWQPILGHKVAATYEMILRFAYGESETCTVSLHRLAASLGMDRNQLKGRDRRDGRQGRNGGYRERGTIDALCDAGLLEVHSQGRPGRQSYLFRIVKSPPPLTDEQVGRLPAVLQRAHRELIERCRRDLEKRRQMQPLLPPRNPSQPDDAGIQHQVTLAPRGDDAVTHRRMTASSQTIQTDFLALPPHTNNHAKVPLPEEVVVVVRDSLFEEIKPSSLLQLVSQYGAERVALAIDALTWQYRRSGRRIKHPLSLLQKTLRADIQIPDDYIPHRDRVQRDQETRDAAEAQRIVEEAERQQAIERRRRAEAIFQELSPEKQEELRQRAMERIPAGFHGVRILADHALYQLVTEEGMGVSNERQATVLGDSLSDGLQRGDDSSQLDGGGNGNGGGTEV